MDANVFPGSSGSPVFLKPSPFIFDVDEDGEAKDGIKFGRMKQAKFIGMVKGFIPYQDVCVSRQTKREKIIFEENSSLAEVICFNKISKIMKSKSFLDHLGEFKKNKGGK